MRYVALLTAVLMIIAGSALAEGNCRGDDCTCQGTMEDCTGDCCTCDSEECDSVCQCEGDCTCDGTVEGCTSDCCSCAADCESVCDCQGDCTCQEEETVETPEETQGCGGCPGGGCN